MRIKIVLLTALFLAFGSSGFAQSNARQQLRRYIPQVRSTQQDLGPDKLSVGFDSSIPLSTERVLVRYVTQNYKIAQLIIGLYKLQGENNLYFVTGTVNKDRQSEDSPAQSILLALRAEGDKVTEVSKAENDSDAAIKEPAFFLGQDRLLIIVSHSAPDGSLSGHYAYEYAGNNLKPLGEIPVIDKTGMSGSVWITNNQIDRATAEYKNNTYFVTMRGKGSLYEPVGDGASYKKIASPGSPVTFSYDGGEWRSIATRRIRRR
ncbi:MAG: hypothetical protein QOH63_2567 [Acidobacteriota bacterium]|jgi:hypothetical protein|nr:hypothetical protein [Acidobacteriota bacterium]